MTLIEALRQYTVGPFSIFDFVIAYAGFYVAAPFIIGGFRRFRIRATRATIMWLVLPLSVVVHVAVHTPTPLSKMVIDPSSNILAKLIVVTMIYFAWRSRETSTPDRNK